jgi:acyl-[acyl-carrier-protein]-phospholipid O-acyltransferase/long-chain-fatty-acid--[acyl-carrier-protein] ligase
MPDARKGERVVLLTTQKDAERSAMQRQAKATGASELAVPATVQVVDKVPLLGSGKTDYVAATALAKELAAAPATEAPAEEAVAPGVAAQEVA